MVFPELTQAKKLTDCTVIPLRRELFSDIKTPIEVLRILRSASRHCFILESVENQERWGRYTFLGYDPKLEISCINGEVTIKDIRTGRREKSRTEHPAEYIQGLLDKYKSPSPDTLPGLPSFSGGLVGYFGYDYIKYCEPRLKLDAADDEGFKDVDLMLFDKVIAFDSLRQKMILIVNIEASDLEKNYREGVQILEEMTELIRSGKPAPEPKSRLTSGFRQLFDKDQYCKIVERAKHYIREGDIFQCVPSNRLDADFEGSLLDTYRMLRIANPSPYMFYFSSDDMDVAGASPETLVKLEDGILHTFPIAGSRPRGSSPEEDEGLEKELLADEKELSEHNMLVDLGRNDLGKVSEFGSVKVERYMQILKFSHIMHICSTVRGRLRKGLTALDAVEAVLPAGTLSGAPKIRACEIINELENCKRGIYGGAIGYIDLRGNLDTCIGIRLCYKKNGRVFVRSGGGIVADSVPETEYIETVNKAKAVVKALEAVTNGEVSL